MLYWSAVLIITLLIGLSHALMSDQYSATAAKAASVGLAYTVLYSLAFVGARSAGRDARWIFFGGALLASTFNLVDFFAKVFYLSNSKGLGCGLRPST